MLMADEVYRKLSSSLYTDNYPFLRSLPVPASPPASLSSVFYRFPPLETGPIQEKTESQIGHKIQNSVQSYQHSRSRFTAVRRDTHGRELRNQAAESLETMSDAIDLTGDGGVMKTIVRRAKHDAVAPSENLPLVDVHYEGILAETGEVFDTTHEDNTIFTFEVGKGTVIKAWDVALRTMKVGEVAKLTCQPEYAYGSAGSPPDIPPNATLIFEVELVACRPRKGSSLGSASDERARLEELKKQREIAAANKEDEKKKREEAKAAAAARIQAKLEAKKGKGKGKAK